MEWTHATKFVVHDGCPHMVSAFYVGCVTLPGNVPQFALWVPEDDFYVFNPVKIAEFIHKFAGWTHTTPANDIARSGVTCRD